MAGGLAGYGGGIIELSAWQADTPAGSSSGEKPSDLPVQQSTKADLIINLKTAKALGIMAEDAPLA